MLPVLLMRGRKEVVASGSGSYSRHLYDGSVSNLPTYLVTQSINQSIKQLILY